MKKIVIIDNYDSFTYNLSHLVKELGADVTVYRNDQFEMSQLEAFDKIILSRVLASRVKQDCCLMSSRPMLVGSPSSAFVLAIRLLARFLEGS